MVYEPGKTVSTNHGSAAIHYDLEESNLGGLYWGVIKTAILSRHQREAGCSPPHPSKIQQNFIQSKVIEALVVSGHVDAGHSLGIGVASLVATQGRPYIKKLEVKD